MSPLIPVGFSGGFFGKLLVQASWWKANQEEQQRLQALPELVQEVTPRESLSMPDQYRSFWRISGEKRAWTTFWEGFCQPQRGGTGQIFLCGSSTRTSIVSGGICLANRASAPGAAIWPSHMFRNLRRFFRTARYCWSCLIAQQGPQGESFD